MASLVSPRRHPGIVTLPYRQCWWKELGWFPLGLRVLQLRYPSPFATLKMTQPVQLEAKGRLDQISRVILEASAREYGQRDRQHRPLSNLPLGPVGALVID